MITAAWPDGSAIHLDPTLAGFIGARHPAVVVGADPPGTLDAPPPVPVITSLAALTMDAIALRSMADILETGALS